MVVYGTVRKECIWYHPGSMNQDRKREQKQRTVEKGERGNIGGLAVNGEDATHLEIVLQKENDLSFFPETFQGPMMTDQLDAGTGVQVLGLFLERSEFRPCVVMHSFLSDVT